MSDYSQKERDLIAILEDNGFAAMRAPASGSATERELPDVLVGRPHYHWHDQTAPVAEVYAIEVKYRSKATTYFDLEEAEDLATFALAFGAKPRFAFRYNANKSFAYGNTDWYFMHPYDVEKTETKVKNEYGVITTAAETLDELVSV